MTVLGRDISAYTDGAECYNRDVIRPYDDPVKPAAGLRVLRGNLAPDGAIVKVAGMARLQFSGPARVFDCEEDAFAAVQNGHIRSGDVVVIRYEGPKGGPGMREMLGVTAAIADEIGVPIERVEGVIDQTFDVDTNRQRWILDTLAQLGDLLSMFLADQCRLRSTLDAIGRLAGLFVLLGPERLWPNRSWHHGQQGFPVSGGGGRRLDDRRCRPMEYLRLAL